MKNKILSVFRRSIPYVRELNTLTGSVRATLLMTQLDYWFAKYPDGFYKFTEPCDHDLYRYDESWIEELGFSPDGFRQAFDKIGVRWKSETQFKEAQSAGLEFFDADGNERYYCAVYFRRKGITMYYRNHSKLDRDLDDLARGTFSPPPAPPQPTSPPPSPSPSPTPPSTNPTPYNLQNPQVTKPESCKLQDSSVTETASCKLQKSQVTEPATCKLPTDTGTPQKRCLEQANREFLQERYSYSTESTAETTNEIFNLSIKNFTEGNEFNESSVQLPPSHSDAYPPLSPNETIPIDVANSIEPIEPINSISPIESSHTTQILSNSTISATLSTCIHTGGDTPPTTLSLQETYQKSPISNERGENKQIPLFEQEHASNRLKMPSNTSSNTPSNTPSNTSSPEHNGDSCNSHVSTHAPSRRSRGASRKGKAVETPEQRAEREQFFGFMHKVNQWLVSHGALSARLDAYWRWYQSLKQRDSSLTFETFSAVLRYYFLDNKTIWANRVRNLPNLRAQFDSIYQTYQVQHNKTLTPKPHDQTQLHHSPQTLVGTTTPQHLPTWKTDYAERLHALSKYGDLYNTHCQQYGYIPFDTFMEQFANTLATATETPFQIMHTP